MDKILAFIKDAKWFSISIGIFMVIWLGPKLLDKIEEIQAEAEQQARIEQQEIARQEQLKKEAIEKAELEKRLAAEKIEEEKRLVAKKNELKKEKERLEEHIKKLAALEIGLVCKSENYQYGREYDDNYKKEPRNTDKQITVKVVLYRRLNLDFRDAGNFYDEMYRGTSKITKKFFSLKASNKFDTLKVSPATIQFNVKPSSLESVNDDLIIIERSSLKFTYKVDYNRSYNHTYWYSGQCEEISPNKLRMEAEAYNLKNDLEI